MRRFKNLEIGGIESKIFNLILLTVIVLTVLFVIFSTSQSKMLSALTSETSVRQQQTTSGIISDTMTQVTQMTCFRISERVSCWWPITQRRSLPIRIVFLQSLIARRTPL